MTTAYYSHSVCLEHHTPPGHPERADRLRAIEKVLSEELFEDLLRIEAPLADETLFELVHSKNFCDHVRSSIPEKGLRRVDADTVASPKTYEAVRRAVGAAVDGVDKLFNKEAQNVFAAMRPPGHHAEKIKAMGFCLINSVAVAARYAQEHYDAERIAIIDFDVHHGNGTQDVFYEDETVLFCSSHQMPLFPGSGAINETGVGNIVNAPLTAGSDGNHFKEAYVERILPEVDNFAPDLILISAGFDAHRLDPLANIELVEEDFDFVTGKIMDLADKHCEKRIVSLLEGGYDLQGLSESVSAHVRRLMNG